MPVTLNVLNLASLNAVHGFQIPEAGIAFAALPINRGEPVIPTQNRLSALYDLALHRQVSNPASYAERLLGREAICWISNDNEKKGPDLPKEPSVSEDLKARCRELYHCIHEENVTPGKVEELLEGLRIEDLIQVLGEPDHPVRKGAAYALEKIGKPAVKSLIEALRHPGFLIRKMTAPILVRIYEETKDKDPEAVDTLFIAFQDRPYAIFEVAIDAILRSGDPRVAERCITLLHDPRAAVRQNAAFALGRMRSLEAIDPLIAAFQDQDYWVRRRVSDALWLIGEPAFKPLMRALRSSDANVRKSAADSLKKIGEPAFKFLLKALRDPNPEARRGVALILGAIKNRRSANALLKALQDPDDKVRISAVSSLVRLGKHAVKPLIEALQQKNKAKALKILAKTLYRQLREQGYEPREMITLSTDLVEFVTDEIKGVP